MQFNLKTLIPLLALILLFSSCYYSFKGSLPSHLKTIAIPLFDDQRAQYPGVREKLTNEVIDEFITDNTLKVVDESKADLLLSGAITSISQSASNVASGEVVEEYKITVSVKVKCEDVKLSKVLYDKNISHYGLMDATKGPDAIDSAIDEALVQITDDILNSTLGAW
ncbi:MAG: LptE family protein [Calditrichaceae bacterium]|jgi:outer membrane lipopolysaccharide assembly protein LptE/RlpB